ncbi:Phosphatidylinositol N-acetylglucosaminyltransferase GPI2 subunit [Nakaseomyces bracarensis]|uniref:Phosphatidylinositol N-acetylglucosaminyltransferase GPI2 subunit n=1 Tax=Nakaseomyces bracarensis TaxID=273131 RepID=A0ABR4NY00_9SACH
MKEKQWHRKLWMKQDFPDTYTDKDFFKFLDELNASKYNNANKQSVDRQKIRKDFLGFYHLVLNTSFVYLIFCYLYYYEYDPLPPSIVMTAIITGCILYKSQEKNNLITLKSAILITFTMLILSPVIKSLSRSSASDSIWTLSFWLSVSYLYVNSSSKKHGNIPTNLSTNILLANVAVLASRLSTTTQVFCFMLLCVEVNIILPTLVSPHNIVYSLTSHIVVYTFVTTTLGINYMISTLIIATAFQVLFPKWFIYWKLHYHRYDNSLLSVWDPAKPILDR